MLNRLRDRLAARNTAEARALDADARRAGAEAAWRAEILGLGDRIARAIIAEAGRLAAEHVEQVHALGIAQAADAFASVARRVAAEAVVTLPGHSITAAPEPPAGRHRSQADQR
jgi:hypothetical protein